MAMNSVVHFELPYVDPKRAADFYTKAFGWDMNQMGEEMGNYIVAHTAPTDKNNMLEKPGAINGGMFKKSAEHTTPSVVIAVDDINAHVEKVAEAGGTIIGKPMEIPGIGMYVSFDDPEGNRLSMLQPNPR